MPMYDAARVEDSVLASGTVDRHSGVIEWRQQVPGDYDQNGEVNIADLTPLALHLGKTTNVGWPAASIESVIDGDGNREINIADITVIGLYYGLKVDSWEVTYPDGMGGEEVYGTAIYPEALGDFANERLRFELVLAYIGPSPSIILRALSDGSPIGRPVSIPEVPPHPPRHYSPVYTLSWDPQAGALVWYRRLSGDGDRNGEVNLSDITPIGVHFNSAGPFDPGSELWHIDYDGNGEINIADLTVVGVNTGATLDGYLFYSTRDPGQLPGNYSYPVLEPVARRSFMPGDESWGQLEFLGGDYVWLRPYVDDPADPINCGQPSEIILIP